MTRDDSQSEQSRARWKAFATNHSPGDRVRATVTRTLPFGSLVEVEGIPGLLTGTGNVTVGDGVDGSIVALDEERQRFIEAASAQDPNDEFDPADCQPTGMTGSWNRLRRC